MNDMKIKETIKTNNGKLKYCLQVEQGEAKMQIYIYQGEIYFESCNYGFNTYPTFDLSCFSKRSFCEFIKSRCKK